MTSPTPDAYEAADTAREHHKIVLTVGWRNGNSPVGLTCGDVRFG